MRFSIANAIRVTWLRPRRKSVNRCIFAAPHRKRPETEAMEEPRRENEDKRAAGLRLAQFSLDYPVTILMIFASFMVLGAVSISRIPIVLTPDISFPFVNVSVPYPNSTPGQVLESIAKPVEEALSTLPNVQRLQSRSNDDGANVSIGLEWDKTST